ncbi:MAG: EpsI family protein [Pirellulales bacterium]|nr:EpsI family protein [Pirellulales bacterium]
MIRLALPIAAVLIVLAISTYYQGYWSERWNQAELDAELKSASARIANVPEFIGDWKGETQPVDQKQLAQAHVTAHQSREFRNVKTGDKIGCFLVCGKPRHVAIHTPDDCYVAAGFQMLGKVEPITIETSDGQKAQFNTTVFRKQQGETKETLRIFWAWNHGTGWEAPLFPRLKYGTGAALYKMYCILPSDEDRPLDDQHPCVRFIKAVVPKVSLALFPGDAPAAAPSEGSTTPAAPKPETAKTSEPAAETPAG